MQFLILIICFTEVIETTSAEAADTKIVSVLLDLARESECNYVENHLAIEVASEAARQRAEAVLWSLHRMSETSFLGEIYFFL